MPWAAGMVWHGPGSGRCGKEQQQADDRRDRGKGKEKYRRTGEKRGDDRKKNAEEKERIVVSRKYNEDGKEGQLTGRINR